MAWAVRRYLEEWLAYHALIGVQHFFLASNDCADGPFARAEAVLAPHVRAGLVTLDVSYRCDTHFQERAYNALYRHVLNGSLARW